MDYKIINLLFLFFTSLFLSEIKSTLLQIWIVLAFIAQVISEKK